MVPYWTTEASPDVLGRICGRSDVRQKVRSGDRVTIKLAAVADNTPIAGYGGRRGGGGSRGGRQRTVRGVRSGTGSAHATVLGFTNVNRFHVQYVSTAQWFASDMSSDPRQWLWRSTVVLPVSIQDTSLEPVVFDPKECSGSLSVVVQCDGEDFLRVLPVDEVVQSVLSKAEHKLSATGTPLEEPTSFEEFSCLVREAHEMLDPEDFVSTLSAVSRAAEKYRTSNKVLSWSTFSRAIASEGAWKLGRATPAMVLSLLMHFDDLLRFVLPFVSVSPAVGCCDSRFATLTRHVPTTLRGLLSRCRSLIPFSMLQSLLRLVQSRTETPTSHPEDEWENPSELPTILVDRAK
jgi:hypothetical protein